MCRVERKFIDPVLEVHGAACVEEQLWQIRVEGLSEHQATESLVWIRFESESISVTFSTLHHFKRN